MRIVGRSHRCYGAKRASPRWTCGDHRRRWPVIRRGGRIKLRPYGRGTMKLKRMSGGFAAGDAVLAGCGVAPVGLYPIRLLAAACGDLRVVEGGDEREAAENVADDCREEEAADRFLPGCRAGEQHVKALDRTGDDM